MTLQTIAKEAYSRFARDWMKRGNKQLDEDVFDEIYERFGGHTWYVQYILNRLYGQSKSVIDRGVVEACLTSIIQSEIDSYQLLYGMLTENQSTLLRAIAREGIVAAINSSAFVKKYRL